VVQGSRAQDGGAHGSGAQGGGGKTFANIGHKVEGHMV
jgi:hypothetical protein